MSDVLRDPCATIDTRQHITEGCRKYQAPWILAATILGSSMAFIDGSVVNMVLPVLQQQLAASTSQTQWIIESYALFLAALILVGGALGDIHGHRKIFSIGVVSFSLASLLCGLAQDADQLILARALQGIGGALMVPGSLAIISANFPAERRGAAIGTWSAVTALTMAVGPIFGAWLADTFSWRWIFFLNLPIGLLVIAILYWRVPETQRANCRPLDKTGALLTTVGLALITFGLTEAGSYGLRHPLIITTSFGGVIILTFFIRHQARNQHPMLPLHLFQSMNFSGANLMTFLLYAALGGAFFFIPFNLINIQGYSSSQAAAAYLPFIIIMVTFSRAAGQFADKYGARLPMTLGPFITSVGYLLLTIPGAGINYWLHIFPAMLIQGIGMTMTVAPLTATVMNSVTEENLGIASGINNMVSRTAGLLAIALFGLIFIYSGQHLLAQIPGDGLVSHELLNQYIDAGNLLAIPVFASNTSASVQATINTLYETIFISAYRSTMYLAALLAFISGIISWLTIRATKEH